MLLGMKEPALLRLEGGAEHEDYTLSFLERLASVIDVPFAELFRRDSPGHDDADAGNADLQHEGEAAVRSQR